MLAYDSNIFYNATRDCRFAQNKEKCKIMKSQALTALQLGRVEGCTILPTVEREVRRSWIEEYASFCKVKSLKPKEKMFVDRFVNKLATIAMKDQKFLEVCTSKAPDKHARIAKAMEGDWKIVAQSFLSDEPMRLISFDHNIHDPYCKQIYRNVAKEVAEELNIKITEDWDALKPAEILKRLVKDEEAESSY